MNELKIVFMGTPEFGLPTLKALNETYNVVGVACQPDRPSNRGEIKFSKIKEYALENNIKVFQPEKLEDEFTVNGVVRGDIRLNNKNRIAMICGYITIQKLENDHIILNGDGEIHADTITMDIFNMNHKKTPPPITMQYFYSLW